MFFFNHGQLKVFTLIKVFPPLLYHFNRHSYLRDMITKYVTMKRSSAIIVNSRQWSDYPFQTGKMWKNGSKHCRTSHAQHGELKELTKAILEKGPGGRMIIG